MIKESKARQTAREKFARATFRIFEAAAQPDGVKQASDSNVKAAADKKMAAYAAQREVVRQKQEASLAAICAK